MGFPTTPLLDNFVRADEDPLSGGGVWSNPIPGFVSACKIVGNVVVAVSVGGAARYALTGANIEAWVTISTIAASRDFSVTARGSGTDAGYGAYAFTVTSGTGAYLLQRIVALSPTTIASGTLSGGALLSGDSIGLRCIDTWIEMWLKRAAGAWTVVGGVADTQHTSGSIGFTIGGGADWDINAFGGGRWDPGHGYADDRYRFKPSQHFVHHTRVGAKRALWPPDAGWQTLHLDAERDRRTVII